MDYKYLFGKKDLLIDSHACLLEMTTVAYCYKIGSILRYNDLFEMKTIGHEIYFPESLDIDTHKDLELARILFDKFIY